MSTMVEQRPQPLGGYDPYERLPCSTTQWRNPWESSSGSRQLYDHHNSSPAPNEHYNSQPYNNTAALGTGASALIPHEHTVANYSPVAPDHQPRSIAADFSSSAPTSAPFTSTSADRYSTEQFQPSYGSYEQRWAQYQQQQQQARKQHFA